MSEAAKQPPLSIADLAARWGCSTETVMDRVRTRGIPYVWLGRGEPRLTEAGRKFLVFRAAAIEAWEAQQERTWPAPGAEGEAKAPPKAVPVAGWDGVSRLGGRRRRPRPAAG